MSDRPMEDQPDTAARAEMELRDRMTVLESREAILFWMVIGCYVTVMGFGLILIIAAAKAKET